METKSTCPYCGVGCGVIIQHDGKRVIEVRGDPEHPRAISLIAIHAAGIPVVFPPAALAEAESAIPADLQGREDLRGLPLVTIDGADARDFDDAVWAEPDGDPQNPGGWHLVDDVAFLSIPEPGTAALLLLGAVLLARKKKAAARK